MKLFFKNFSKKTNIILFIIIFAAAFLRFYNLDTNPPGIHADEADSGYNAYSILKTGKDFYGNFLPTEIVGFAHNYRTPLSTYLTIPFVAVLDLNPFSVRMPTALLGTLFVILVYILVKRLFESDKIALIASFISAINPWAVHISRAYADHILALDFVMLAIVLLLFKKKNTVHYISAGICLGLSLFSYHAPKLFLPLFLPTLSIFLVKKRSVERKYLGMALAVFLIFFSIVIVKSVFGNGGQEYKNVTVIDRATAEKIVNKERRVTNAPLSVSGIFHNKPLFYLKEIERNAGKFLSINYLFLDGESNLTAWVGDRGLFYPIELPFLFLGIYFLFNKKRRIFWFLFFWFLAAIVPGVITKDQMYTYRGIYLLPVMLIFISFGIYSFFEVINKRYIKLSIILLSFLYFFSAIFYFFHYFYDFPVYARPWWAAEEHDAIKYITDNQNNYDKVFVDGGIDWILLYGFDNKSDPRKFQEAMRNSAMVNGRNFVKIDKLYVGSVMPEKTETLKDFFPANSLYIGKGGQFDNEKSFYEILSKEDWGTIFRMFEVK